MSLRPVLKRFSNEMRLGHPLTPALDAECMPFAARLPALRLTPHRDAYHSRLGARATQSSCGKGAHMNLLLAIDDSAGSQAALRRVVERIPKLAHVKVLSVVEPPSASVKFAVAAAGQVVGYPASLAPETEAATKRARQIVDEAVEELQRAGFSASGAVEFGDARSVIIDTAAQEGDELIVVGAHGRTGLERLLLGSVSEAVARHAPCSVEIVRNPAKK
jgi:nucleotide-binding universal stress UspA family protein